MKKIITPQYDKKDLLIFIKKIEQDYKMIDSKFLEILNQKNICKEISRELYTLFEEYTVTLNKHALERNDKIKAIHEFLKKFNF